ncbi:peptidylprolyl isomerase [Planococcus plakortidis]|uniref:Peptidyl-prolyl cis-trans isomerase n=1 Tax=Planococcus plakortidis TaxID=1038856 RepID=A0A1C7EE41_9BACL|nr:peptidylprolyl isomerase [Planococcus plakortidis]ANU21642.1 peptidylprolyl isomerase [Planococcus plakortidis]
MKKSLWLAMFLLAALALAACGNAGEQQETSGKEPAATEDVQGYPQLEPGLTEETVVDMNTSEGTIRIRLFPEIAPKAVENFLGHAESGYYDGVTFHRVIEGFMLQGGDPTGTGSGGESIYGEPFEDEFSDRLFNFRGALSMANAGPGTNGSQFFIVQAKEIKEGSASDYPEEITAAYEEMGGTPWLDGMHTVFGQVDEGMDVVDQIAAVEKGAGDKPLEDIVIESIDIIEQ